MLHLSKNPLRELPRFIADSELTLSMPNYPCPVINALANFQKLSDDKKHEVYLQIWDLAGKPECVDPDRWGNTHLLEDLERFQKAMQYILAIDIAVELTGSSD